MKNNLVKVSLFGLLAFVAQVSATEVEESVFVEVPEEVAAAALEQGRSVFVVESGDIVVDEFVSAEEDLEAVRSAFPSDAFDQAAKLATCEDSEVEGIIRSLFVNFEPEKVSKFSLTPSNVMAAFQAAMSGHVSMSEDRAQLVVDLLHVLMSHHVASTQNEAANSEAK